MKTYSYNDLNRQIEASKWGIRYDVVTMDYSSLYPVSMDTERLEKIADELERKRKILLREQRLDQILGESNPQKDQ